MKSKNGYLVGYDTQKRKKYSDEKRLEIVNMKRSGMSIRKIAKALDIPNGSIHYILREYGEVVLFSERPSVNHIKRAEADYLYNVKGYSFDYFRGTYPEYFVKVGNTVYADRKVFELYVVDKIGMKKVTEDTILKIQDLTMDTDYSQRQIARMTGVTQRTVLNYSMRDMKLKD